MAWDPASPSGSPLKYAWPFFTVTVLVPMFDLRIAFIESVMVMVTTSSSGTSIGSQNS